MREEKRGTEGKREKGPRGWGDTGNLTAAWSLVKYISTQEFSMVEANQNITPSDKFSFNLKLKFKYLCSL